MADDLRRREQERVAALSPAERVAEALALGERDLEIQRAKWGLDRSEARREIERVRQQGRRRSRCMQDGVD
ncbi:MAG: hypothetical protein IT386_09265 [Deltaproteobacteria bacterium]|nr:hypothetical protein [Deltaproteobacteria bacterium]